jgi:hypothetical protein
VVGLEGAPDRLRDEFPRLRDLGVSEGFVMLWDEESGLGPRLERMSRARDMMTA